MPFDFFLNHRLTLGTPVRFSQLLSKVRHSLTIRGKAGQPFAPTAMKHTRRDP
jgi:hypothetical protein